MRRFFFPLSYNGDPRPLRAALMFGCLVLAGSAWAGGANGIGVAALNPQRPARDLSASLQTTEVANVSVPRSRADALTLLHRVASRLERGSNEGADRALMMKELDAATDFARSLDRSTLQGDSFQWHRAGALVPEGEAGRAVVRPLSNLRYVSALAIGIPDGGVVVDRVRAYGASGMVFEFDAARRQVGERNGREVLLIDREFELTAVEIFYRMTPESTGARLTVEAGISVAPRFAGECAYRLQLAHQSVRDGHFAAACSRVREGMALIASVR